MAPKKSKKGSKKKGFYVWLHWKIKAHEAAKRDRDPMKGRPENIFAPSIMNGGDGRHHVHFVVMQMWKKNEEEEKKTKKTRLEKTCECVRLRPAVWQPLPEMRGSFSPLPAPDTSECTLLSSFHPFSFSSILWTTTIRGLYMCNTLLDFFKSARATLCDTSA